MSLKKNTSPRKKPPVPVRKSSRTSGGKPPVETYIPEEALETLKKLVLTSLEEHFNTSDGKIMVCVFSESGGKIRLHRRTHHFPLKELDTCIIALENDLSNIQH